MTSSDPTIHSVSFPAYWIGDLYSKDCVVYPARAEAWIEGVLDALVIVESDDPEFEGMDQEEVSGPFLEQKTVERVMRMFLKPITYNDKSKDDK